VHVFDAAIGSPTGRMKVTERKSIRSFGITTPPSRLTLDHLSRHRFGVVKRVLGLLLAQNFLLKEHSA
jgi:hypothetical protein